MLDDVPAGTELPTATNELTQTSDSTATEALIQSLTQEIRAKDEYLRNAQELLDSSNEELKSSNEEMQSINEELQSSNEELETSKEELQSVNEELTTVNVELQTKVVDLSRANDDMNNLLAGSGVETLFVDHELRILRFTPSIAEVVHLIESDIGRPVAHFVSNLENYSTLVADLQQVLSTLMPVQHEVRAQSGQWYLLRIQPYRTLKNVIEGAVVSLTNITVLKQTEASLRNANQALQHMAVVVRDSSDAITVQNLEGRTLTWNPGATRLYGWNEAQALQMNVRDRIPANLRESELTRLASLSQSKVMTPYLTQRMTQSGAVLDVYISASPLLNQAGGLYAIATTERANIRDFS
jgi:two-component system, chemotaxis family, CheB/CheR fusion protein